MASLTRRLLNIDRLPLSCLTYIYLQAQYVDFIALVILSVGVARTSRFYRVTDFWWPGFSSSFIPKVCLGVHPNLANSISRDWGGHNWILTVSGDLWMISLRSLDLILDRLEVPLSSRNNVIWTPRSWFIKKKPRSGETTSKKPLIPSLAGPLSDVPGRWSL